jgi:hypothetical protein
MTTDTSFDIELERGLTHLATYAPQRHVSADVVR